VEDVSGYFRHARVAPRRHWIQNINGHDGAMKTERLLFTTNAQVVHQILDDGDHSEPKQLCGESLIIVRDDSGRSMTFTGEEMTDMARKWIALPKVKSIKPPPYE
jgi:hypothetical protein